MQEIFRFSILCTSLHFWAARARRRAWTSLAATLWSSPSTTTCTGAWPCSASWARSRRRAAARTRRAPARAGPSCCTSTPCPVRGPPYPALPPPCPTLTRGRGCVPATRCMGIGSARARPCARTRRALRGWRAAAPLPGCESVRPQRVSEAWCPSMGEAMGRWWVSPGGLACRPCAPSGAAGGGAGHTLGTVRKGINEYLTREWQRKVPHVQPAPKPCQTLPNRAKSRRSLLARRHGGPAAGRAHAPRRNEL